MCGFYSFLFPGTAGKIIMKLSEFAVPIFLMITGFYSYSENENMESKLRSRAKHLGKITIYAVAFYFVFTLCFKIKDHIIGAGHLWYLPALLIAYFFLIIIERHKLFKTIFKMLPVICLFRIAIYTITLTNNYSWYFRGNFLVDSLPWILLGGYFASKHN